MHTRHMLLIILVLLLVTLLSRHQQSAIRLYPDTNARSPDDWVIWDRQRTWRDYQKGVGDAYNVAYNAGNVAYNFVNEGVPTVLDAVTGSARTTIDLLDEYNQKGGVRTVIDRLDNVGLNESLDRAGVQMKRAYADGTYMGSVGEWYSQDINLAMQKQVQLVEQKHPGMSPKVTTGAHKKMNDSFAPFANHWAILDAIETRDKYDAGELEALLPSQDVEARRQNLLNLIAKAEDGVNLLELLQYNATSKTTGQLDPLVDENTNDLLDTQNKNLKTLRLLFKLHYPGFWNKFASTPWDRMRTLDPQVFLV